MKALALKGVDGQEIQRLEALIPAEIRSHVVITRSETNQSVPVVATRTEQGQFVIHIDWMQWQQFPSMQRDLLFWREVAQIQGRPLTKSTWMGVVMGMGVSASCLELLSQNLFSFAVALAVTGLAAYRFYQRRYGEENLRAETAADQAAIDLAIQFGYSSTEAHQSLYEAIRFLAKQASRTYRKKYQVRLRVLEMLAPPTNSPTSSPLPDLRATSSHKNSHRLAF